MHSWLRRRPHHRRLPCALPADLVGRFLVKGGETIWVDGPLARAVRARRHLKRCEVYPVKRFGEPYGEETKGHICGSSPRDHARMGAPIRHLTPILAEREARTRLPFTLSDGKSDDYDYQYRGEYGIEDTRQALFEARREGVHPFCITIDEQGADYRPHMYGPANFTVIADVTRLPLKVSDIYRKLTS